VFGWVSHERDEEAEGEVSEGEEGEFMAARRIKGVVRPQAAPTRRKPRT
jgi:hypothetical protein